MSLVTATATASDFGMLLRGWRLERGLSQLRLAGDAEVSTRHLSCLERGKSAPSREMVLVLGSALELPLRERNELLAAAGFTPAYSESALDAAAMEPVRRALDLILEAHEPYPAVVVDRAWVLRRANGPAQRIFGAILGGGELLGGNAMEVLFDPQGLRPFVRNLDEVGEAVITRLAEEARRDPVIAELLARLEGRGWLEARWRRPRVPDDVIVPMHLAFGSMEARLFTTMTTLGTPRDVAAQELRIEAYHPMDEATRVLLQSFAS